MRAERIAILALFVVSACSTMTMRISRSELQADLATRFPVEADRYGVVLKASDPRIEFPGKPDVIGVRLRLDATSASGNSRLGGTTRVEGRLEYVELERAFYLRDPVVTELALAPADGDGVLARAMDGAIDSLGSELIERAARAAIEALLRRKPIYQLDPRRSRKEAKAIRHLRSVRVEGQDLVLEVAL